MRFEGQHDGQSLVRLLRSRNVSRYVQGAYIPQWHGDAPVEHIDVECKSGQVIKFHNGTNRPWTGVGPKDWGFYCTAHNIQRLHADGFRTALVRNRYGMLYVWCIDVTKMDVFEEYCQIEPRGGPHEVVMWLDDLPGEKKKPDDMVGKSVAVPT